MCLAIPMQIIEINGFVARCEAKGVQRDVSLFMLQDEPLSCMDYIMVHVGYAIQKITEQDALSSWELFDEIRQVSEQNREQTQADRAQNSQIKTTCNSNTKTELEYDA